MRTTLNIKDELLNKARRLSKIDEKTSLVNAGLQALIEKYTKQRLRALGGTEKSLKDISRRK